MGNSRINEMNLQKQFLEQVHREWSGLPELHILPIVAPAGTNSKPKGRIRIMSKHFKTLLHLVPLENCSPGHPNIFICPKCPLLYFRPHTQHHWYLHYGQVIWLQPSFFCILTLHLGQLLTSPDLIAQLKYSLSIALLHFLPLCHAIPQSKHI